MVAADDGADVDAAGRVCLGVKEALGAHDAVSAGTLEVGGCKIVEIILVLEHVHRRVVDGEEGGQVVELVGRLHFLDCALADVDAVLAGQREFQVGFEGSLEVEVQLGLGQAEREVAGNVGVHGSS